MKKKNILQLILFLLLMLLTFYAILSQNDIQSLLTSLRGLHPLYLLSGIAAACFFVSAEGFMIWYLLRSGGKRSTLLRCIGYSYIGFFFSGITPSATGGQPAQLYYMKKDGIPLADGTVTLMTIAVLYKLVLVLIGAAMLLFWREGLNAYLGKYMALYYLGILLNSLLVILLLLIMFHGEWMESIIGKAEGLCIRLKLCKPSEKRKEALHRMVREYQEALRFFMCHTSKIIFVACCTFLQRTSLFILTYFIYRGLRLSTYDIFVIMALQASVYIAVDMLPLPGSQGISELLYHTVFIHIFTGGHLAASMCVTRGISFYLPLLAGGIITLIRFLVSKKALISIKDTQASV